MNISRAEPEWDKSYHPDLKFELISVLRNKKNGLVKGFVSIVGPVPPYGRLAKRWDHGAFIQFGLVLLGVFLKMLKRN